MYTFLIFYITLLKGTKISWAIGGGRGPRGPPSKYAPARKSTKLRENK